MVERGVVIDGNRVDMVHTADEQIDLVLVQQSLNQSQRRFSNPLGLETDENGNDASVRSLQPAGFLVEVIVQPRQARLVVVDVLVGIEVDGVTRHMFCEAEDGHAAGDGGLNNGFEGGGGVAAKLAGMGVVRPRHYHSVRPFFLADHWMVGYANNVAHVRKMPGCDAAAADYNKTITTLLCTVRRRRTRWAMFEKGELWSRTLLHVLPVTQLKTSDCIP